METVSNQLAKTEVDFERVFDALIEPSASLEDEDLEALSALRPEMRTRLAAALPEGPLMTFHSSSCRAARASGSV